MRTEIIPSQVSVVYTHDGSFAKGIAALNRQKVEIYTAAELALLRQQAGPTHPVSTHWTWVGENYNHFPNGDILIAAREYNSLIPNARAATQVHREGGEFFLDDNVIAALRERAHEDPVEARKTGVLLVQRQNVQNEYPVTALAEAAVPLFLFQDQAQSYGLWLEDQGITHISHVVTGADYVRSQGHAFGRALWVGSLDDGSSLGGDSFDLHIGGGRVGGVRSVPAERAAGYLRR